MAEDCVLKALWFSVVPLQVLGTNPIILRKYKDKTSYGVSIFGLVYLAITIAGLLTALYMAYLVLPQVIQVGDLNLLILMMKLRVIGGPLCSILMLTSALTGVPTVCTMLSGFKEVSTAIPHQFGRFYIRTTMQCSVAMYILLIVFIPLMVAFEAEAILHVTHSSLHSWDYACFLICWVCFDVISWANLAQLLILGGTLYYELQTIDRELTKNFEAVGSWGWSPHTLKVVHSHRSGSGLPAHLRKLQSLYVHLVGVGENLNKTFNTRLVVIVGFNTVLLCFAAFTLLLNLDQMADAPPLSSVIPWLLMRFIPLYISIYPFCAIRSKIHDILTTIHYWITKVDHENILHELGKFSNLIKNRKLHLSAHGFFELDNATLSSIINNAISYLIIIVQFHMMFRKWMGNNPLLASGAGYRGQNFTNISGAFDNYFNNFSTPYE